MRFRTVCFLLLLLTALPAAAAEKKPLALKDGERVVLVGNTFVEREGEDCYLEALLTAHFPGRDLTFRNLGWGGDTVDVQARPPTYKDLKHWVHFAKPTVVFVS